MAGQHGHLLQNILDQMVSGGSPGRGPRSGCLQHCAQRHSAPTPRTVPKLSKVRLWQILMENTFNLPRTALAVVTCLGKHLALRGSSGRVHVTLPATGAGTSILGCPSGLLWSLLQCQESIITLGHGNVHTGLDYTL